LGRYCPEVSLDKELYDPRHIGILIEKSRAGRLSHLAKKRHDDIERLGLKVGMRCKEGIISSISDGYICFRGGMAGHWNPENVTPLD
jgi:hypothetical protein